LLDLVHASTYDIWSNYYGLPEKKTVEIKKNINWLVVLTILKNMKVSGKDSPIYYG
jgi:hypothetical protein